MKKKAKMEKRLGPPIQVRFFNEDVTEARQMAAEQGLEVAQILRRAVRVGLALVRQEQPKAA